MLRLQRRSTALATCALIPLALAAALCTFSCGAPETGDEPAAGSVPVDGGTLVFGAEGEPRELNCTRSSDAPAVRVCRLVCDTLIAYDRNLEIVPLLAESFAVSGDGTTITFRLRRGVRWHDGAPFTARDVLYSVEQIRAPGAMVRGSLPGLFEPLVALDAPDDFTVTARYREPFALAYQAWTRTFIMPAHLPFSPGESAPTDRAPIGTGPFRFLRWDPGERIVLEANREYFAGRPHLDRFIYRVVPDSHTLAVALRGGEVDLAALPPNLAPAPDEEAPFRIRRYAPLSLDFILWNTREPPGLFADPRVRRALSLAFDRRAYIDHVTGGDDLPAVSSFHPRIWAHDTALDPLPHDPERAAALLAEAGWADRDGDGILETPSGPASFTLLFNSGLPAHERIASLFQDAVKPLGIDVRLLGIEWPLLLEKISGRSFEASVYRWGLDVDPDPYDFFHSSQAVSGQNYGGYANPEVDRLAEEGRGTLDPAARAALYHRVERILREEQPYTFISHPAAVLGTSRRVQGVSFGPSGFFGWYPASLEWWVTASPPRRR